MRNESALELIAITSGLLGLSTSLLPSTAKGGIGIVLLIGTGIAVLLHLLLSLKQKRLVRGIIEIILAIGISFWGVCGVVKFFTVYLANKPDLWKF